MITRRHFLILLASLAATNNTANASNKSPKTSFALKDSQRFCVYKGWVLRADDLQDGA